MEESLEATKDEESLFLSARCEIGFGPRMADRFDRGRTYNVDEDSDEDGV
jgi:hypothetical protein